VEALVEGQARKEQLMRALQPLTRNPAVRIDVRTLAEATRRRDLTRVPGLVLGVEATRDRVAAYDTVRRRVGRRSSGRRPAACGGQSAGRGDPVGFHDTNWRNGASSAPYTNGVP